jgi:hypothetical protein
LHGRGTLKTSTRCVVILPHTIISFRQWRNFAYIEGNSEVWQSSDGSIA